MMRTCVYVVDTQVTEKFRFVRRISNEFLLAGGTQRCSVALASVMYRQHCNLWLFTSLGRGHLS
jgi:hypothetical protein